MSGTIRDRYGLEISTTSDKAVERYADAIDLLLSMNAGAGPVLEQALALDDGLALAHATLALTLLGSGDRLAARAHIARAQSLSGGLTRRESQHVQVLAELVVGNGPRAIALIREHLFDFPRDMYLVFHALYLLVYGGGGDWHRSLATLLEPLTQSCGDDWWFLSASGFLHQEQGRFDEARRLAGRSLGIYPRNAFAVHALAHVFYETNAHADGVRFLGQWLAGYPRGSPYRSHLSWHQALCQLASGGCDGVMDLYRREISPSAVQSRTTLFDAASLLWRMQVYDCATVPLPVEEVRAYAASLPVTGPPVPFNAVHAAVAFAAAQDEASLARLFDALRALAASGQHVVEDSVLPIVSGIAAFAREQYDAAIGYLEPALAERTAIAIGGTNAQREVLEDTLITAYVRGGRLAEAKALLARRLRKRPSARDVVWLGQTKRNDRSLQDDK
jgi:tetratricopeptide (TPR) repeat protein